MEIKATLAETAKAYTPQAMQTLIDVMQDARASPAARAVCANSVLDRGWGKPTQQIEHTGKDGAPIATKEVGDYSNNEIARRIAFALVGAAPPKTAEDAAESK